MSTLTKDSIRTSLDHRLTALIEDLYETSQHPRWLAYEARGRKGRHDMCLYVDDALVFAPDAVGQFLALKRVANLRGWPVTQEREDSSTCSGRTDWAHHLINICPTHTPVVRANTMAHELAHTALHPLSGLEDELTDTLDLLMAVFEKMQGDMEREVEAETVAYLVSQSLGTDASWFTKPYLLEYGPGYVEACETLTKCRGRILDAAAGILSEVRFGS
jgi:hypothetical protein